MKSDDLFLVIKKALIEKTPISILRYGDGESTIMRFLEDHTFHHVLTRQMGYLPSTKDMRHIRENLIQAFNEADIIGIPQHSKVNDPNTTWYKVNNALYDNVNLDEKQITDADFHTRFLTKDYYKEILTNADEVYIISCRDIGERLKEKYNIGAVHLYLIAPEAKFTSYQGKRHYPDQYLSIQTWIKSIQCQGKLCLFGAGIIGKIYGSWFKQQGGIAVDIGSVFDTWAGRITRGVDRGLDVIDHSIAL